MKFILTGSTGFIGSEVLFQALQNPTITSIIVLSRRALPSSVPEDPKLRVVVLKDFTTYPESLLEDLSGADAAIWCMGKPTGTKVLEYDYPLAFISAYSKTLQISKKKFRYLHLSGTAVERDQKKSLWFMGDVRKIKGATETKLLDFAKEEGNAGLWETVIARAGLVAPKTVTSIKGQALDVLGKVLGNSMAMRVDDLAAALIDVAIHGSEQDTLGCEALVTRGKRVLEDGKTRL